jgi:prepilin-type N-terminal cleavage/methylation domain-containing protein
VSSSRRPLTEKGPEAGFTLIEVLIVVVIIGMLPGIVVFARQTQ